MTLFILSVNVKSLIFFRCLLSQILNIFSTSYFSVFLLQFEVVDFRRDVYQTLSLFRISYTYSWTAATAADVSPLFGLSPWPLNGCHTLGPRLGLVRRLSAEFRRYYTPGRCCSQSWDFLSLPHVFIDLVLIEIWCALGLFQRKLSKTAFFRKMKVLYKESKRIFTCLRIWHNRFQNLISSLLWTGFRANPIGVFCVAKCENRIFVFLSTRAKRCVKIRVTWHDHVMR